MIPKEAKRVFKGVVFDVYQWEQVLYDGSVRTFESIKRPDSTEIIAVVGETLVLLTEQQPQKPKPFLSLPGGGVDEGETPLEGARRELLEETGLAGKDWETLRVFEPSSRIDWRVHTFIVRDCHKVQESHPGAGEKNTLHLVDFDAWLQAALDPTFRHHSLKADMIRALYDQTFRKTFHTSIFGSGV